MGQGCCKQIGGRRLAKKTQGPKSRSPRCKNNKKRWKKYGKLQKAAPRLEPMTYGIFACCLTTGVAVHPFI